MAAPREKKLALWLGQFARDYGISRETLYQYLRMAA
jgi:hypothetical protein